MRKRQGNVKKKEIDFVWVELDYKGNDSYNKKGGWSGTVRIKG